jgi:small subunit ribosomal protein S2
MTLPTASLRQLIEAGAHFGHNTRRWNPKMKPYLYGVRDGVHIIDLQQTVPMLDRALKAIHDIVAEGGRVLFVGTKRQAQELVKEYAERCGQYYVNHRWLGGTLTNWKTVSNSIKRLKDLEEQLANEQKLAGLTKKEQLNLQRERDKLNRALGGIKDMGGRPDILFVIDTNKETIAVAEARTLGIPVVAVLDSNSDPSGIAYPIPGNDDAIRAIKLYCELVANTVLDGISDEMKSAGVDIGEAEAAPAEALPAESASADKAEDDDKKTVVVKKSRSRARSAKKAAEDAAAAAETGT